LPRIKTLKLALFPMDMVSLSLEIKVILIIKLI